MNITLVIARTDRRYEGLRSKFLTIVDKGSA